MYALANRDVFCVHARTPPTCHARAGSARVGGEQSDRDCGDVS